MQKEQLSALMDGEMTESEVLNALSHDREWQESWQRYHLIRDTLRGDVSRVVHLDISARVAESLEREAIYLPAQESQPAPHLWQKMPFWHKVRPWAAQLTQVGVAACMSLAVIVGVQNYNASEESSDLPVLNTMPLGGVASQVSYGVPTEVAGGQMQQLQEQRKRINAMLQDYELQRRLQAEQRLDVKDIGASLYRDEEQPIGMHQP